MDELESHNCLYRAIADQMLDLVTIADLKGTLLYATPSIERILGRAAQDRVGQSLFEFVHADDVARVRGAFDEAVKTGEASTPITYRCRHRDGDWRVLESVGGRCVDPSGVMLMLVQSRDVTERASAVHPAHSSALKEAANLSGSIGRDFGNLLVVLAREVAILETRPATRAEVQPMRAAIDRAGALVSQLLTFSQLDEVHAGESTDVNRTLEEMAADLDRMSGPGVEIIYLLGAAEASVAMSRMALERVLVELVARACDAMPRGQLTILTRNTLAPRSVPSSATQAAGQLVIEITDAATSPVDEGRLRHVYALVQRAGGDVAVDSVVNRGTTVRVQLPVAVGG